MLIFCRFCLTMTLMGSKEIRNLETSHLRRYSYLFLLTHSTVHELFAFSSFPLSFYQSVLLFLSLCTNVSLSFSIYPCLSLSLSLFLSVFLYLSFYLSIFMCLSKSLSLSIFLCIFFSFFLCNTLGLNYNTFDYQSKLFSLYLPMYSLLCFAR